MICEEMQEFSKPVELWVVPPIMHKPYVTMGTMHLPQNNEICVF